MYYVYFLESKKNDQYYIGSSDDVSDRLQQHNGGQSRSTAPYRPWKLVRVEEFATRSAARQREQFLKKKKSRKIIQHIINTPSLSHPQS